jgi:hypothetical protein
LAKGMGRAGANLEFSGTIVDTACISQDHSLRMFARATELRILHLAPR